MPQDAEPSDKMRYKLKTVEDRKTYADRKSTIETVFGIIKQILGFRQFLFRGLNTVAGEWTLVSITWNIKRTFVLKC
ncbi:transposase [Desulfocastanea catecholica]